LIVTAPLAIAGDGVVVVWAKPIEVISKNNKNIFFMLKCLMIKRAVKKTALFKRFSITV